MKRFIDKLILSALIIAAAATGVIFYGKQVYSAVSGETLLNVQNPSVSGTVIAPVRIKDGGSIGNNITAGILPAGLMLHDGTNWDKVTGDTTNGIDVDVTRITGTLTIAGNITPADALANPTTSLNSNALISGFNGTTWDRIRSEGTNADDDAVVTLGVLATEAYNKVFDGTTWDRLRSGITTGSVLVDSTSNASSNIVTNTTTAVKATGGVLNHIIVNSAGTGSTVALYNIASAGCTGTPGSGFVGTLATTTAFSALEYDHTFTLGICAVTAGAAAANISVLYR